jgi:demethylmenaquinone methyltransferase/2-methoxy-6-polyprenyl-1,4-benzoquinol methylase
MFDGIARRYDLLNRIISLGLDQRWRKKTVRCLELQPGQRLLDLATGTGDLAIQVARRHPEVDVVGLDPSAGMLEVARKKCERKQLTARIELVTGDAQELPYEAASFDAVTMGFGIRNVPDRLRALREIARVVKPGGRVGILELSEPRGGLMGRLARLHVHVIVPRLGALLSGSKEYRYLQQSVAAFPPAAEFVDMMAEAGIRAQARPLAFGACHLYAGEVSP